MDHGVKSGPRANKEKGTSGLRPKGANRAPTYISHPGQELLPAPLKGDAASASLSPSLDNRRPIRPSPFPSPPTVLVLSLPLRASAGEHQMLRDISNILDAR